MVTTGMMTARVGVGVRVGVALMEMAETVVWWWIWGGDRVRDQVKGWEDNKHKENLGGMNLKGYMIATGTVMIAKQMVFLSHSGAANAD